MGNQVRQRNVIACDPNETRGRFHKEPESTGRSVYQRDRDRIIHSTALRRLKHKTQVFVYHEGDHFRTRLTHSLEVAQIARSIARSLGLDEDLTEALALAHDLGHTPFGHSGEDALNACMEEWGGFDHNAQSLRIVTLLERRYAGFDGLNLTLETLEGLIKHNGPLVDERGKPVGRYEKTELPAGFTEFSHLDELEPASFASAEAQVAAISDDIAYNAHDIDDGLRAGLFEVIDLADVPLAGEALSEVLKIHPQLERSRLVHETVRRVISAMVSDVVSRTRRNIEKSRVANVDDVRDLGEPLVVFSPQLAENNRVLKAFLSKRMYHHEKVHRIMERAKRVIRELFDCYMETPSTAPKEWRGFAGSDDETVHARQVCDFIAGMTDRYAIDEHKRLFDLAPLFR
ncbi:MAG: deoxyguanosinetriphosphate triphosphohydrolase [Hyphomicrobiales bacterium]